MGASTEQAPWPCPRTQCLGLTLLPLDLPPSSQIRMLRACARARQGHRRDGGGGGGGRGRGQCGHGPSWALGRDESGSPTAPSAHGSSSSGDLGGCTGVGLDPAPGCRRRQLRLSGCCGEGEPGKRRYCDRCCREDAGLARERSGDKSSVPFGDPVPQPSAVPAPNCAASALSPFVQPRYQALNACVKPVCPGGAPAAATPATGSSPACRPRSGHAHGVCVCACLCMSTRLCARLCVYTAVCVQVPGSACRLSPPQAPLAAAGFPE